MATGLNPLASPYTPAGRTPTGPFLAPPAPGGPPEEPSSTQGLIKKLQTMQGESDILLNSAKKILDDKGALLTQLGSIKEAINKLKEKLTTTNLKLSETADIKEKLNVANDAQKLLVDELKNAMAAVNMAELKTELTTIQENLKEINDSLDAAASTGGKKRRRTKKKRKQRGGYVYGRSATKTKKHKTRGKKHTKTRGKSRTRKSKR